MSFKKSLMSLLGGIAISLCTTSAQSADPVADFTLVSATDTSLIRLSDHSGKVVLLNFWRTSCPICQHETPQLIKLYEKYRKQGLDIIGVADEDADTVSQIAPFLRRHKVPWPVALRDLGGFEKHIASKGSTATPANYLVSRSGELTFLGVIRDPKADWPKIEQAVQKALAEKAPQQPAIVRQEPRMAPGFELKDNSGKTVSLKDFAGKPILLNFVARGCEYAIKDRIARIQRDYAKTPLQIVTIYLYPEDGDIAKYIEKYNIPFPIFAGAEDVQRAWLKSNSTFGVFFVSHEGQIINMFTSWLGTESAGEAMYRKYADNLLQSYRAKMNSGQDPQGSDMTWRTLLKRGNDERKAGVRLHEKSIKTLTQAIKLKADEPVLWNNRGYAHFLRREHERAIADYTQALKVNPRYVLAVKNRAWCYRETGQMERAIADYSRILELEPTYFIALETRGAWLRKQGKLDEAIADYTKALNLNPTNVMTWNNRGYAYYLNKQYPSAITDLKKALELNPDYPPARENLRLAEQAQNGSPVRK